MTNASPVLQVVGGAAARGGALQARRGEPAAAPRRGARPGRAAAPRAALPLPRQPDARPQPVRRAALPPAARARARRPRRQWRRRPRPRPRPQPRAGPAQPRPGTLPGLGRAQPRAQPQQILAAAHPAGGAPRAEAPLVSSGRDHTGLTLRRRALPTTTAMMLRTPALARVRVGFLF